MSTEPERASRSLPDRPDLRHLKNQAKDLLKAGDAGSLSDAQLKVARQYGFPSWPKLKAHVESLQEAGQLKEAITANDLDRVRAMMTRNSVLHGAPIGYGKNGPLTWAAECRAAPPTVERLAMAQWMIENGSDVHQGGDGPLMRAALSDERIPMMELLVKYGANVNALWDGRYPIICAPCETLQPMALKWLIDHGADMHVISADYGNCVQMLIGTYWRNAKGKHECLDVFAAHGYPFPDTAPMAIHRGRIDLLEALLNRDPAVLQRRFSEAEIYPAELGMKTGYCYGLMDGVTLLHIAIEFLDGDVAKWLIDRGADVNARAAIDGDGFGGHTPLFHTTISPFRNAAEMARLLLRNGADPSARATLRKQLRDMADGEKEQMREFHNVTAIEFARQFQEPRWINEEAINAISDYRAAT
jgi:ankyrin repeat protein